MNNAVKACCRAGRPQEAEAILAKSLERGLVPEVGVALPLLMLRFVPFCCSGKEIRPLCLSSPTPFGWRPTFDASLYSLLRVLSLLAGAILDGG